MRKLFTPSIPSEPIRAMGLQFAHAVGLAAGLDKNGICIPALSALGFSFIEIGTVTPQPQPGNPRPRIFRLTEDEALINRMGFPSAGMQVVARNLARLSKHPCPIGISLGKNKTTPLLDAYRDYAAALECLYPFGDFFVVNVSSPNTPELRDLQTREYLATILGQLRAKVDTLSQAHAGSNTKPLLVKIAPDLTWAEIDTVIDLLTLHKFAGMLATNTTAKRAVLRSRHRHEADRLSGPPLSARSNEIIRSIPAQSRGALCVIGVGRIFTAADLQEKLEPGAT